MSIDMGQNDRRYGKVIFYTKFYKKNGKGKGGKYLEKEEIFCGGEENRRRKRRKYLEKENIFVAEVLEGCNRVLERLAPPPG